MERQRGRLMALQHTGQEDARTDLQTDPSNERSPTGVDTRGIGSVSVDRRPKSKVEVLSHPKGHVEVFARVTGAQELRPNGRFAVVDAGRSEGEATPHIRDGLKAVVRTTPGGSDDKRTIWSWRAGWIGDVSSGERLQL